MKTILNNKKTIINSLKKHVKYKKFKINYGLNIII